MGCIECFADNCCWIPQTESLPPLQQVVHEGKSIVEVTLLPFHLDLQRSSDIRLQEDYEAEWHFQRKCQQFAQHGSNKNRFHGKLHSQLLGASFAHTM